MKCSGNSSPPQKVIQSATVIGTYACVPQEDNWKARCFCKIRNLFFRIGLIKGFNGALFTTQPLFEEIGGYNEERWTFEHADLIRRAIREGARWVFLADTYVAISMRRYETNGYLRTLLWWTWEFFRYKLHLRSRRWTLGGNLRKEE